MSDVSFRPGHLRHWAPLVLLALAACAARPDGSAVDGLDPAPIRVAGIAAVGVGSGFHLYDGDGAPEVRRLDPRRVNRDDTITWLGHAGVLVRVGGRAVMIDPMLSERLGLPLPIGPRRVSPPPDIAALDRLDVVAISHADHDHYDLPTLRRLAERFPRAQLVTPVGIGAGSKGFGFAAVHEVTEGGSLTVAGLRLTAAPAYHYGRRDVVGLFRTPAIGWLIEGGGRRIHHSGDTGYGPAFRAFGKRHGPIDLSLVAIGAYRPEAFFRDMHASPEEAVAIALDLRARRVMPHHWGTFSLGPESPTEAKQRFLTAARGRIEARVPAVGETVAIGR